MTIFRLVDFTTDKPIMTDSDYCSHVWMRACIEGKGKGRRQARLKIEIGVLGVGTD